jgi:hypothetical protein
VGSRLSVLLFVWACATPAMAQPVDQRLVSLRKWIAENEAKRHDFKSTIHRFVAVTSPQGNYPKFNGVTYEAYWLHDRDCVSHIVWDDPGGPSPILDADGCIPKGSPYLYPISLVRIAETRVPSSITPVVLPNGKPGLRFLFPPVRRNPLASYEQSCSNAVELDAYVDAATYAFVRTELIVKTSGCKKKNLPIGTRSMDEYKTFPDNFTTSVHAVFSSPPLASGTRLASRTTLGRKFTFEQPLLNAATTAETEVLHLERQTDIQINPVSRPSLEKEEVLP